MCLKIKSAVREREPAQKASGTLGLTDSEDTEIPCLAQFERGDSQSLANDSVQAEIAPNLKLCAHTESERVRQSLSLVFAARAHLFLEFCHISRSVK